MQLIRCSFSRIDGAADDVRFTSGTINGLLEDLKKRIIPVVSTWEGESSDSYQEVQYEWDTATEGLNMVLTVIADTVSTGSQRMADINRRAAAS